MKNQFMVAVFLSSALLAGCASENKNRDKGAGIGAAAGAVLGGVIGHQSGNRERGAILGAAMGGAIGGVAGSRMDKQAKELEKIAETKRTEQGLVTQLKNDILFDTGKSNLKPDAEYNLKKMATIMKKYPENVLAVNGYTDSTGGKRLNEQLSEQRAEAVRKALIENGIPAETVTVKGMGPADPIGDNSTEDGRMKNRRVEIQITVDESKIPKKKTAQSK